MRDILTRVSSGRPGSSTLTEIQAQVDQGVRGFVSQATNGVLLASMVGGAAAYRLGKLGLASLGSGSLIRPLSVVGGLAAEVSTFELTHRALQQGNPPRLWKWDGNGGLKQGLSHSLITFGILKGAGRLAQDQNFLVQHLFQDTALVLGQQGAGILGIAPRPKGSLAEQFLHAEATNLEVGAGMALAYRMAPGVHAFEKGLGLSFGSGPVGANLVFARNGDRDGRSQGSPLQPSFALALPSGRSAFPLMKEKPSERPFILFSEKLKDGEETSAPDSGDEGRADSEPPVTGGVIEENASEWAAQNLRPDDEAKLVGNLAWGIREEMWNTLNLRIDSPEARALAMGDLLSVQLHPVDGSLENFKVVLSANLETPPKDAEYVQWTLDPVTGALAATDTAAQPPPHGHRLGFIPFYRWIDFISEGLKSNSLFEALSPQIQEFLKTDRTLIPAVKEDHPTVQQVAGPTLLVSYFNQIAESARDSVDRYCLLHHLPEKGQVRLQRLVQLVLAAIHEKELSFPKYSQYPTFHIWVIPHPDQPGKKRLEVLTASEAWQWHQDRGGRVGNKDILLVLDRSYWGTDKEKPPYLAHQYTHKTSSGKPLGADLEFQKSLGLGEKRLNLKLMDLAPNPETIAEWNENK